MATPAPPLPPTIARFLERRPTCVWPEVVAEWTPLFGGSVSQLMLALVPWATKTFPRPPISKYQVGAVGLGGTGALYFGGNMEFPGDALTSTIHAEQSVVQNAIGADERTLKALAISAAPCGYCRQFLYETRGADALQVHLTDGTSSPFTGLLPNAFGPKDLGVKSALMDTQANELAVVPEPTDRLVLAALAAAKACYAPYTQGYAGIALAVGDRTFVGGLTENAAYNPSMGPLEVALNALALAGRSHDDVTRAVLVEMRGAPASQAPGARALLRAVCGVELQVVLAEPA